MQISTFPPPLAGWCAPRTCRGSGGAGWEPAGPGGALAGALGAVQCPGGTASATQRSKDSSAPRSVPRFPQP